MRGGSDGERFRKAHRLLHELTEGTRPTTIERDALTWRDPSTQNGLVHVCSYGDLASALRQLIGAEPSFVHLCNRNSESPLHVAAANNSLGAIRVLLEFGASAEALDNSGSTPMMRAAACSHPEATSLLAALTLHGDRDLDGQSGLEIALAVHSERPSQAKEALSFSISSSSSNSSSNSSSSSNSNSCSNSSSSTKTGQCVDCATHSAHLRHDYRRYCSVADRLLVSLVAAVSQQAGLSVRRLVAYKSPPASAARIGALEVVMAISVQGCWHSRLVFSKLNTGNWPNASRVAKDGIDFLTSVLGPASLSDHSQSLDDVWRWMARLGCAGPGEGAGRHDASAQVTAAARSAGEECVSEGMHRALLHASPEGRAPAIAKAAERVRRVRSFLGPLEASGGVEMEEEERALVRHFCVFDRTERAAPVKRENAQVFPPST